MADQPTRAGARGDEAELFRAQNPRLLREISHAVSASPAVVEDACAFAWSQFMQHQPARDQNWQGWLFRTAQREAWRLERLAHEHIPLRTHEDERMTDFADVVDPRDKIAIHQGTQEALSIVGALPRRLQRIAMLRALGLRYSDISDFTGDSPTRVAQLVTRANLEIHEIISDRERDDRPSSPRARRLDDLEREQPEWLVSKLGRLPTYKRINDSHATRRRAWRRAALALDDLRDLTGPEMFDDVLASRRPIDPDLRRLHETARQAIEDLEHERSPRRNGIGD